MKPEHPICGRPQTKAGEPFGRNERRELKRIDWEIVKRIVVQLYRKDGMKRTSIAMKCMLSYGNCLLYLDWLDLMGLIKREHGKGGFELISLTENGRDLYERRMRGPG